MATSISEGTRTVEPEETPEECSGKKKSKFQAFKKFFVKKKRKESTTPRRESNLKPSQSSSDVSASGGNAVAFQAEHEPVAKGNMGNKAVSHDSVFISEMESSVKEDLSQECTPGKVKALQLQLQQNIRIGSPPQGIVHRKVEDPGALSEDDGLPRSPPEIASLHEILQSSVKSSISAQRRSSISSGGTDSEEEPESSELSSRPTSPSDSNVLLSPTSPVSHFPLADFTCPASSVTCLDNSAAKHKILVKPKKRRAPTMNAKPTQAEKLQPINIADSKKDNVVHEAPSEQVKHTEDVVLQKPKEAIPEDTSVCEPQIDESELNCNNSTATLLLEFSPPENQIVSFENEAVFSESDVDFHGSLISTGDKVGTSEEASERHDVPTSPETSEINDFTITVKPFEINNVESPESKMVSVQNPNSNTSEDLVHCALGQYQPNVVEDEATEVNENKDEEYNEHHKPLPDVQIGLLNVTKSDLVASETIESCALSTEAETAVINSNELHEHAVSTEGIESHDGNDGVHLDNIKQLQNPDLILEVSDPLAADDEITNECLPSEQKTEALEQRITVGCDEQSDMVNVSDGKVHAVIKYESSYNETSTEPVKENKVAEPNPDDTVKASNKPVRFTVAPAWQRALSSGSSVKDSPFTKNTVGNIVMSESFDGTDESIVQSSIKDNVVQKNKEESCGHFGVKLRRTSSSIKYSEENQEEVSRQGVSPLDTSSLLPGRNQQTPKKIQVNTEFAKMSKVSCTNEEKSSPDVKSHLKPKVDDPTPQENSEPAWITMAKLKQKGFQEHPLAREQSSSESEKAEGTECIQRKHTVTVLQEAEEKKSENTAADSPAAPADAQPNSEKSSPSATQQQHSAEPPWFSLAKKKAKAWSEMPQIVQQ
ncbi:acrosomal protein KIAA1210 homolog isoform X2 [Engystomops pustulosus]